MQIRYDTVKHEIQQIDISESFIQILHGNAGKQQLYCSKLIQNVKIKSLVKEETCKSLAMSKHELDRAKEICKNQNRIYKPGLLSLD